MHTDDISPWVHSHTFHSGNAAGERNTWRVVGLTATMMVVEIAAGWLFNSMALLADGWHMSTHALALSVTAIAYLLARRHSGDASFAFGTWKIEVLGGFASAIVLAMIALYMALESFQRFFQPLQIHYDQALIVAVLGLAVNAASAFLLREHDHGHGHEHAHAHEDGHAHLHEHEHEDELEGAHAGRPTRDLNLLAAYTHVIADALTSVLAIVALTGGRLWGWAWLDPAMGIVGAVVVAAWSVGLLKSTGKVLLDRDPDDSLSDRVRRTLETDGDTRVSDLHLWRVGPERYACVVSVVSGEPQAPATYKSLLAPLGQELAHVTVEVSPCRD